MTMNHSYRFIKPMISSSSFGDALIHGPLIGILKRYHTNIPTHNIDDDTEPFSLIVPRVRTNLVFDKWRNNAFSPIILGPGMVLFKNYITLMGQVDIVNICEKWGVGRGGFYQPSNESGVKLRLHMMCFGRNWDPVTKYKKRFRSDGSEPPPLPYEFISLTENTIQDAQLHLKTPLPAMHPDICVANFYHIGSRFGLHQDCDESSDSIQRGLPVVSISIGVNAEFFYGLIKDENKLEKVLLESGDVLVFGGESRLIFHGVKQVIQDTAPSEFTDATVLKPGRLNLTFRQF